MRSRIDGQCVRGGETLKMVEVEFLVWDHSREHPLHVRPWRVLSE